MGSTTKTTKSLTRAESEANLIAANAAIEASKRARHFDSLNGFGEMVDYSGQAKVLERRTRDIIVKHELNDFDGYTVAIIVETGKEAKCYGGHVTLKRIEATDTGADLVINIALHASIFSKSLIEIDIAILEALTHARVFVGALSKGDVKVSYGMAKSGVHNSTFAGLFHTFGGTVEPVYEVRKGQSVLTNGKEANRPTGKLDPATVKVLERSYFDPTAFVVTGEIIVGDGGGRTSADVLRVACEDHPKIPWSVSYRGRKPTVNIKCTIKDRGKPECGKRLSAAAWESTKDSRK